MVQIKQISVVRDADEIVASAHISMPGLEDTAWYRLPGGSATDSEAASDAFFIIGLLLAMGTDQELEFATPVSARLLYNSRAIQSILTNWHPERLASASMNVSERKEDLQSLRTSAVTCFTGGVDSFYSFVTNQDDIGSLLYLHWFDAPSDRGGAREEKAANLREERSAHLRDVANTAGKELIEVSTNIRRFLNLAGEWGRVTHGPALASVGHLLSAKTGRLLIPASHTFKDSYPWGSHPLLDHLWSSDRITVVHDGAEATRVDKVRAIAFDPSARNHLQVCWQKSGKYNCGKCEKCLRTKIALKLSGVLADFRTFDSELSLDAVLGMKVRNDSDFSFVVENLAFAKEQGASDLGQALQKVHDSYYGRQQKAGVESSVGALERRVHRLENALAATDDTIVQIRKLWPIRAWHRFAKWRHR